MKLDLLQGGVCGDYLFNFVNDLFLEHPFLSSSFLSCLLLLLLFSELFVIVNVVMKM